MTYYQGEFAYNRGQIPFYKVVLLILGGNSLVEGAIFF